MADSCYVVHYSEVALKGKNRPEFVKILRHNLSRSLYPFHNKIESRDGRLIVRVEGDPASVGPRISNVFGVAWFARADIVDPDYSAIEDKTLRAARESEALTFMIDARRADKTFPLGSMEIARRLGSAVVVSTGKRVDLSRPGLKIHVDIIRKHALVYGVRNLGPGGLPVGTSGRSMHLFSAGIDSPVAAWLLMKRGVRPVFLHFYLAPTPAAVMKSKVIHLVRILSAWGGKSTLVLVPFAEYQLATVDVPEALEPSLFRRFMRMVAERLAAGFNAYAVSTGDSLSQAASQTMWNIAAIDSGSSVPILRPLLTYDKEEIVNLAKKIGTYEISLQEYKDCCAVVTRHPKTRARASEISEYVERRDFAGLAIKSLKSASLVTYNPIHDQLKAIQLTGAIALFNQIESVRVRMEGLLSHPENGQT